MTDGILCSARMVGPQPHELQAAPCALELPDAVLDALRGGEVSSRVVTHGLELGMTLPVAAPGNERAWALRVAWAPVTLITAEDHALMESRLRDLREHHQQLQPQSTNRRLSMLAILSSIYMSATLIAGIYGMNFDHIPIAALSHGCFIVMAFMVIVVLTHFLYFRQRGWFK